MKKSCILLISITISFIIILSPISVFASKLEAPSDLSTPIIYDYLNYSIEHNSYQVQSSQPFLSDFIATKPENSNVYAIGRRSQVNVFMQLRSFPCGPLSSSNATNYTNSAASQWGNALSYTINIITDFSDWNLGSIIIYNASTQTILRYEPWYDPNNLVSCTSTASVVIPERFRFVHGTVDYYELNWSRIFIPPVDNWSSSAYHQAYLHEVGHALGWLGHSRDSGDVMYHLTHPIRTVLTSRDKKHLRQIYVPTW